MSERERGLFGVWSRLAQRIGGRETHILIENWGGGAGERDCLNRSEREGDMSVSEHALLTLINYSFVLHYSISSKHTRTLIN